MCYPSIDKAFGHSKTRVCRIAYGIFAIIYFYADLTLPMSVWSDAKEAEISIWRYFYKKSLWVLYNEQDQNIISKSECSGV